MIWQRKPKCTACDGRGALDRGWIAPYETYWETCVACDGTGDQLHALTLRLDALEKNSLTPAVRRLLQNVESVTGKAARHEDRCRTWERDVAEDNCNCWVGLLRSSARLVREEMGEESGNY